MLKRLVDQLTSALSPDGPSRDDPEAREHALRLATAALLVEVSRADHEFDEAELRSLVELLASHFDLTRDEAADLADEAHEIALRAVDVHSFTQKLHENLSEDEKAHIVALLWQIAYADGSLDKYEDSLVLKISDLLHVSRGRVMRLKHDAQQGA